MRRSGIANSLKVHLAFGWCFWGFRPGPGTPSICALFCLLSVILQLKLKQACSSNSYNLTESSALFLIGFGICFLQ